MSVRNLHARRSWSLCKHSFIAARCATDMQKSRACSLHAAHIKAIQDGVCSGVPADATARIWVRRPCKHGTQNKQQHYDLAPPSSAADTCVRQSETCKYAGTREILMQSPISMIT